jgi:hypothetical protein
MRTCRNTSIRALEPQRLQCTHCNTGSVSSADSLVFRIALPGPGFRWHPAGFPKTGKYLYRQAEVLCHRFDALAGPQRRATVSSFDRLPGKLAAQTLRLLQA